MPFHSFGTPERRDIQERDRTARSLLNLGRSTTTTRPYRLHDVLGVPTVTLDTELFNNFLLYCATLETTNFTDTEMSLFLIKLSTDTDTNIPEIDRERVFEELSNQILHLVEYIETEDVDITQEWRDDSELNKDKDNTWR